MFAFVPSVRSLSFPVNGKFSDDQLVVYNAVLDAQLKVIQLMRPGISWMEMHRTAEGAILEALQKGGLIKSESNIQEMIDADVGAIFMPHGLGHLIGIDTHDVGGYMDGITPTRSKRPGANKLQPPLHSSRLGKETGLTADAPYRQYILHGLCVSGPLVDWIS